MSTRDLNMPRVQGRAMAQRERSSDGLNSTHRSNSQAKVVIPTADVVYNSSAPHNNTATSRSALTSVSKANAPTATTVRPRSSQQRRRQAVAKVAANAESKAPTDDALSVEAQLDESCLASGDGLRHVSADDVNVEAEDVTKTAASGTRDDASDAAELVETKRSPSRVRFADDDQLATSMDELSMDDNRIIKLNQTEPETLNVDTDLPRETTQNECEPAESDTACVPTTQVPIEVNGAAGADGAAFFVTEKEGCQDVDDIEVCANPDISCSDAQP